MPGLCALIIPSLLSFFLLASPEIASAQSEPAGVCIEPTPEEREKYPNRLGCGSDAPAQRGEGETFTGNPIRVALACPLMCGFAGALGGSLIAQPNNPEANQWELGAVGLTSVVLEIATLGNKWHPLVKGAMGGVAGYAGGWAIGTYNDQTTGTAAGSPESKAKPWAFIGAAATATTDVVIATAVLNHIPLLRRRSLKSNPVQVISTGRRMGMRIEW